MIAHDAGSRRGRLRRRGSRFSDGLGLRLVLFSALFLALLLLLGQLAFFLAGSPSRVEGLPLWGSVAFLLAALGANVLMLERFDGVPVGAAGLPGWSGWWREALLGFGLGGTLMLLVVGGFVVAGWLSWRVDPSGGTMALPARIAGATLGLGAAAWGEELVFRGYAFQWIAARYGGPVAIGITSVGFGLVHLANPGVGPIAIGNIVLAGVFLGTAYWKTYSLWFAGGVHLGWNWFMGVAVDLPVSGITLGMPGYESVLTGPEAWTGGAFGPEAGLMVTLAAVLGVGWLATRRPRRNLVVLALGAIPERGRPGSGS